MQLERLVVINHRAKTFLYVLGPAIVKRNFFLRRSTRVKFKGSVLDRAKVRNRQRLPIKSIFCTLKTSFTRIAARAEILG